MSKEVCSSQKPTSRIRTAGAAADPAAAVLRAACPAAHPADMQLQEGIVQEEALDAVGQRPEDIPDQVQDRSLAAAEVHRTRDLEGQEVHVGVPEGASLVQGTAGQAGGCHQDRAWVCHLGAAERVRAVEERAGCQLGALFASAEVGQILLQAGGLGLAMTRGQGGRLARLQEPVLAVGRSSPLL